MPTKIPLETVISRLPSFVQIAPESYKGMRYPARFLDIEYQEEFSAIPCAVIQLQHGCKKRADSKRRETNTRLFKGKRGVENKTPIEEIIASLPDFLEIDPDSYKGKRYNARFFDKEYKVWFESLPANVLRGKGYCPQRKKDEFVKTITVPVEEIEKKIQALYGDKITLVKETYRGTNQICQWRKGDKIFKCEPFRMTSGKYIDRQALEKWKRAVLDRDDSICQKCGSIVKLCAHHIYPIHSHPEKKLDPDNGIALCVPCHNEYHAKYKMNESLENLFEFVSNEEVINTIKARLQKL